MNLSLPRKYRPKTFSDVVGHNVQKLCISNSILDQNIHQSFLFTGTRGIGKTTLARILSMVINCHDLKYDEEGNAVQCFTCGSCKKFTEKQIFDVIEIDAATYTSVDSIREILNDINIRPIDLKYKVYIIDEVHMLSKSAFNALLKTLEEPPSFVKFIFATTEIHKIPLTILSRCQKFYLQDASEKEIAENIRNISIKEQFDISNDALDLIAKNSDGSFRDSLSILDQVLSSSLRENLSSINENDVKKVIHFNEDKKGIDFFQIAISENENKLESIMKIIENISSTNIKLFLLEILEIINECIFFLNNIKINNQKDLLFQDLKEKNLINIPKLVRFFDIINNGLNLYKDLPNKILFQIIAIKIIYISNLPTPIESIKILDNKIIQDAFNTFDNSRIIK